MKKKLKYCVSVVNIKTGECRAYLTDHYESADEQIILSDGTDEIVFVNEFEVGIIRTS